MESIDRSADVNMIVLAHDISSNALGRALSMALVARELGAVKVFAFGKGTIWSGSSQFDLDVKRVGSGWKAELADALAAGRGGRPIVWICKGISPLPKVVDYLCENHPETRLILDLDDDDVGLASEFYRVSLANKIRLILNWPMLPWVIHRAQRKIASLVGAFTFSSNALSAAYPPEYRPSARVPHVRKRAQARTPVEAEGEHALSEDSIAVSAYGTLRAHKGGALILEAIRRNPDLHLFTFEQCGLPPRQVNDRNWTEIAPSTPLENAYSYVSVAVIPITSRHPSAQLQFPAKLVDAMMAGVAVVATGTPPVREYAGQCFVDLPNDATPDELAELIRIASRSQLGQKLNLLYEEKLRPKMVSKDLRRLIFEFSDVDDMYRIEGLS